MRTFKDYLADDIQAVFLNTDEFADTYIIDGEEVKASLDSSNDGKHPLAYAEGVSLVTDTLFVDVLELGRTPKQDSWMKINGVDYRVVHVDSVKGMLTISLEVNAG